jgi:Divergent InlB B-repeat domain
MVPAMGLDRVGAFPRRLLIVLAATCFVFAVHASLARAELCSSGCSWQSGPLVESSDSNCVTGNSEQEAGSWLSYYINPQSPPQPGQTYYVAIDLAGIGDPCAGIYADIELAMPAGTSPAITASDPVLCYLKSPGSSSYKRDTQDCPQSLSQGEYGYSLDPVHANPPFWPTARGSDVEIQVPVVSTQAGDLQLKGVVQLADGQSDPILQATLDMIIDSADAQDVNDQDEQFGVTYPSPSITSNVYQTGGTYEGDTLVTTTGDVWNYSNPGTVTVQVAFANSNQCQDLTVLNQAPYDLSTSGDQGTEVQPEFALYPGVAYCWRLTAHVDSGAEAGDYDGNWEYFVTNGTYVSHSGEPPAANGQSVSQCSSNGSGCANSGCASGSSCGTGGSLTSATEPLDLTISGSGAGTVTGPADFSCTASCTGNFATGSSVTLTAKASSGSFLGWSGGGCSGTGTCTVAMSAAQSVTAEFVRVISIGNYTLLVSLTGAGSGKVTSSDGISCPGTCSHTYGRNGSDTLTATATPGSTFEGWSGGGCSGTGTCHVLMTANKSVTAEFGLNPPDTDTLTVALAGTGSGKITSPGGISCPSSCDHVYTSGTNDTLTAAAAPGSRFTGWSGGGCSGTGTCKVTVSSALDVTADFALEPPVCSLSLVSSKITLRKKRQAPPVDELVLAVKCNQGASARIGGTLTEQLTEKHSKRLKLGTATASITAGVERTLDLKLPAAAIKGLKQRRKESVSLALTATNANGNATARASAGRLRGSG